GPDLEEHANARRGGLESKPRGAESPTPLEDGRIPLWKIRIPLHERGKLVERLSRALDLERGRSRITLREDVPDGERGGHKIEAVGQGDLARQQTVGEGSPPALEAALFHSK